ncbi:TIGR01777 family oxidoreductase [Cytobacillus solani]|uniref:Multidrug MFS transporter n=1 Tax=Cytobacillus solani TaxID=1637975 RepID=A0A0Q3T3Y5_9BACI|nr:TIGR01777 family oxidoreductase [Cytobacillus solani]KOP70919.1 multidrug MFS transporter [Bacillus sp. FJAT-21945]KQL18133.1 multidrug MFS transporter [Cytobacillus solani]
MKIAVTGGTGFVGHALTKEFVQKGHEVFILTRKMDVKENKKQVTYVQWLNEGDRPWEILEDVDVFINLAGESINSGRWSKNRKKRILKSRISATNEVEKILSRLQKKPEVLIQASAVGFYGISDSETFTEDSREAGDDFLARTVQQWEATAHNAEDLGIRTVYCRFGIILDDTDGALPRIALPYKAFAGGTVGSGDQWVSWIHLKDVVNGILFVAANKHVKGPVNFTAPNPVKMKEFGQTLGKVLHRPHWIPAPRFALKIALGEMSILVLEGQKVLPQKLLAHGYTFLYRDLKNALEDIY